MIVHVPSSRIAHSDQAWKHSTLFRPLSDQQDSRSLLRGQPLLHPYPVSRQYQQFHLTLAMKTVSWIHSTPKTAVVDVPSATHSNDTKKKIPLWNDEVCTVSRLPAVNESTKSIDPSLTLLVQSHHNQPKSRLASSNVLLLLRSVSPCPQQALHTKHLHESFSASTMLSG